MKVGQKLKYQLKTNKCNFNEWILGEIMNKNDKIDDLFEIKKLLSKEIEWLHNFKRDYNYILYMYDDSNSNHIETNDNLQYRRQKSLLGSLTKKDKKSGIISSLDEEWLKFNFICKLCQKEKSNEDIFLFTKDCDCKACRDCGILKLTEIMKKQKKLPVKCPGCKSYDVFTFAFVCVCVCACVCACVCVLFVTCVLFFFAVFFFLILTFWRLFVCPFCCFLDSHCKTKNS